MRTHFGVLQSTKFAFRWEERRRRLCARVCENAGKHVMSSDGGLTQSDRYKPRPALLLASQSTKWSEHFQSRRDKRWTLCKRLFKVRFLLWRFRWVERIAVGGGGQGGILFDFIDLLNTCLEQWTGVEDASPLHHFILRIYSCCSLCSSSIADEQIGGEGRCRAYNVLSIFK